MKGKSLQAAFEEMMVRPGIWKTIGLQKQTVLNRRVMMRKKIYPREKLMRRWLKKAGWTCIVEERWDRRKGGK